MFHNYLTVAIRNLLRHKGYSAINILGLSVGMACCILVLLFVQDEFQYDMFHKDGDRIYRIVSDIRPQGGVRNTHIGTSGPLGPAMKEAFAEVEDYVRVFTVLEGVWFRINNKLSVERYCLTDPNIFEFFSLPLLMGNAKTVLQEPFTAVISESLALKHFEGQNPNGSLNTPIEPATFTPLSDLSVYVVLCVETANFSETVAFLEKTWKQFLPNRPFMFRFLDDHLNDSYESEQRIAKSTGVFALVAIGLALLIAFLTVSTQAVRASLTDPVVALRDE